MVFSKFSQKPPPQSPNPLHLALFPSSFHTTSISSLHEVSLFSPIAPFFLPLCLSPPASPSCWCGCLFWCYWFFSIKDCSIHFLRCSPAPDLRVGPTMTELKDCNHIPFPFPGRIRQWRWTWFINSKELNRVQWTLSSHLHIYKA